MSELKTVLVRFNASELREYALDHPGQILNGELQGEPVKLCEITSVSNHSTSIIVKRADGKTILTNAFFMRFPIERYMTKEECFVWTCVVGYKDHMIRVNQDRWQVPQNFYFDCSIAIYEYCRVSFVDGFTSCEYGEPHKFITKVDLDPKFQNNVCDTSMLTPPLKSVGSCQVNASESTLKEFVDCMGSEWTIKKFLGYIFDCVQYPRLTGFYNDTNDLKDVEKACINILKGYFISYALGRIPPSPQNDDRHSLLSSIYRHCLYCGSLPKIEDIKC